MKFECFDKVKVKGTERIGVIINEYDYSCDVKFTDLSSGKYNYNDLELVKKFRIEREIKINKFKIGDRVKVIDKNNYYFGYEGKIYNIYCMEDYNSYFIDFCSDGTWSFTADKLELCFIPQNLNKPNPEDITPQSFESNDGRFRIETVDDGFLELTITAFSSEEDGYYTERDFVSTMLIDYKDLDRLIKILEMAKQINPYKLDGGDE